MIHAAGLVVDVTFIWTPSYAIIWVDCSGRAHGRFTLFTDRQAPTGMLDVRRKDDHQRCMNSPPHRVNGTRKAPYAAHHAPQGMFDDRSCVTYCVDTTKGPQLSQNVRSEIQPKYCQNLAITFFHANRNTAVQPIIVKIQLQLSRQTHRGAR